MADVAVLHAPESAQAGGGADVRVRALVAELSRNWSVDLVTVGPGCDIPANPNTFARVGASVRGVPPRFSQRFDPRARSAVRRAVAGAGVVLAETVFALPYVVGMHPCVVLDAHNVESDVVDRLAQKHPSRLRRAAYARTAAWSHRWELTAASRAAQVWAVSEREATWFARSGADVVVVPNGVYPPTERQPLVPEPSLLFVGSLRARFNRDGVAWFLDACWPQIRDQVPATLHLVGDGSADFTGPGVVAHGFVTDLERIYRSARVAVVPLLDGAGTRLKVVEAMAYGKPVVSTTIGSEGIELEPGRDALIADDAPSFVAGCVRLLADDDESRSLQSAGRRLVEDRYDWRVIGETASRAIGTLLGRAA